MTDQEASSEKSWTADEVIELLSGLQELFEDALMKDEFFMWMKPSPMVDVQELLSEVMPGVYRSDDDESVERGPSQDE